MTGRILVERNVMVRMRDGVQLATDVYRPSDDSIHPVLVYRIPYSKSNASSVGALMINPLTAVDRDYVLQATVAAPRHLKAAVAYLTGANYFNGWTYSGGALELGFNLSWALNHGWDTLARLKLDPAKRQALTQELTAAVTDAYQGHRKSAAGDREFGPQAISGPVTVTLWVASSAPDTDFTGKLVDVEPGGYCAVVADGIIRARYRNSMEKPEWLTPDAIATPTVDLWDVAYTFRPGHSLRLEISSSNFPRFSRNANSTVSPEKARASDFTVAVQQVFHDAEHPSHITLPVVTT